MSSSKYVWGELADVCEILRQLMYEDRDLAKAKMQLPKLEALLEQLPDNDVAIIRAEGFALLHELKEEPEQAIEYRKREIELMEMLHQHIRDNDYDDKTKQSLLNGRDTEDLELRKTIILALEERL